MKTLTCFAVLALALAGCSFHSETVVQKQPATAAVVVPDSAPAAVVVRD